MIDFSTGEVWSMPKVVVGVYALYFEGEIVYIGKSTHVIERIHTHFKLWGDGFDSARYIECNANVLDETEARAINYHKPKHNRRLYHSINNPRPPLRIDWTACDMAFGFLFHTDEYGVRPEELYKRVCSNLRIRPKRPLFFKSLECDERISFSQEEGVYRAKK